MVARADERLGEFLHALHAALEPGAKVVFLDNRFVAGSSSAVSEPDAHGDSHQSRQLADGSTHRIIKNFPSEAQLLAAIADVSGVAPRYTSWPYFWAIDYVTPADRPALHSGLRSNASAKSR